MRPTKSTILFASLFAYSSCDGSGIYNNNPPSLVCGDNCPNTYDPTFLDSDEDGLGDVCDDQPYCATNNEDCAGTCGGLLEPDCCGVCGGDNSQCSNCCGMPFPDDCSEACYEDYCGVCDDIPENDCTLGCTDSGACNYDEEATDDDGSCEYYDPEIMCDCDETFLDVNGDCCGYLLMDECMVCYGNGSSCADSDVDGCLDDIDDAPFEWDDDFDTHGTYYSSTCCSKSPYPVLSQALPLAPSTHQP